MVKAAALGQDLAAIAAWSGRTVRTVKRWLRRYGAAGGGVAAVADAPRAGRPRRARAAYPQAVGAGVGTAPGGVGGPLGCLVSARLGAHPGQTHGGWVPPGRV